MNIALNASSAAAWPQAARANPNFSMNERGLAGRFLLRFGRELNSKGAKIWPRINVKFANCRNNSECLREFAKALGIVTTIREFHVYSRPNLRAFRVQFATKSQ